MKDVREISDAKRRLLQKYLSGDAALAAGARTAIGPRPPGEQAPLSLSQEQLWLREKGTPGIPPLYNECIVVRMAGSIDVVLLERCLTEIIRRHEIWRTTYDTRNGRPVQVVHPAPDSVSLRPIDLRSLAGVRRENEAERIMTEMLQQPFDLQEGPLLRARLIRTRDFEYRLAICAHLSVVDGVSVYQVFPTELAALYHAFSFHRSSPLGKLAVQFGDYAYWQRQWLQGEERARQVAYWRQQLGGSLPVLAWPTDRIRPLKETFRGTIRTFFLPAVHEVAARELSHREGVTLFMTLASVFTALLQCYTRQDDIIVGTLSPAGRKRAEVQGLLGYFLNPVGLRFALAKNPTFRELLQQAQRLTFEAISNDDVPLEFLAQELGTEPKPGRHPFFTVGISLQPPMPALDLEWCVTSMDVDSGGAWWDLYLVFIDRPGRMMGRVQYNPDLFEDQTITQMLEDFQSLLENASANPGKRLSDFAFLSGRGQRRHRP
jgi:hypothetical protein